MRNNLGATGSGKNTPRTSALSKFMLGTTVAATMAIAPVQNTIAADTGSKTLKTPSAQNVMPGWYVRQANGKFVPYSSTNPEHIKAPKVYKLALDPKTNVYKPVHEELKTPNQEPGFFTKLTNKASNVMSNAMGGVGNALSYIGKPAPQPIYLPRNAQIPPTPKAQPETYSNPGAMFALLLKEASAKPQKQLSNSKLRSARKAFGWTQENKVESSEEERATVKQWLGIK